MVTVTQLNSVIGAVRKIFTLQKTFTLSSYVLPCLVTLRIQSYFVDLQRNWPCLAQNNDVLMSWTAQHGGGEIMLQ